MATHPLAQASERSAARRRLAEERAEAADRRARTASGHAERARAAGDSRAAAIHDHEAAIHRRAVEIHQQAVRLQEQHARELEDMLGRSGVDQGALGRIMAEVRRAREEAELRSEQARTYALRARERSVTLQTARNPRRPDG